MAGCCAALAAFLFEYDTPRIVLIRSRKVGLMNRAVQLLILAYVIGWVFVWEKGYQETDSVVSSVTTKVKGVAVTNTSELGFRIWDVADYVIPAQLAGGGSPVSMHLSQQRHGCLLCPRSLVSANSGNVMLGVFTGRMRKDTSPAFVR
ncbi:P2X purinoceptor 4 [Saguinus oedipus]|uniref:P2X purinoceptor 4 n=1 Tax=Saguinus oedipus TaxID=9490 RepID=A0ABQ9V169_SAGOE|nr:P2X purinoceptor 4 [Saguinus oedipus]